MTAVAAQGEVWLLSPHNAQRRTPMSSAFVNNPFWDDIQALIKDRKVHQDTDGVLRPAATYKSDLSALMASYSNAISDPGVVNALASFAITGTMETDAGNAYWSYLLAQLGRPLAVYDTNLRPLRPWVTASKLDNRRRNIALHPHLALLAVGGQPGLTLRSLNHYQGERFAYIGRDPLQTVLGPALRDGWRLMNTATGVRTADHPYSLFLFARGDAAVVRKATGVVLRSWNLDTQLMPIATLYGAGVTR